MHVFDRPLTPLTRFAPGGALAYGVQNDKRVALGTSVLLVLAMGRRFLVGLFPSPSTSQYPGNWRSLTSMCDRSQRTKKFMPAGLITLLSGFMSVRYYQVLFA